jgi:hypothetical protein
VWITICDGWVIETVKVPDVALAIPDPAAGVAEMVKLAEDGVPPAGGVMVRSEKPADVGEMLSVGGLKLGVQPAGKLLTLSTTLPVADPLNVYFEVTCIG